MHAERRRLFEGTIRLIMEWLEDWFEKADGRAGKGVEQVIVGG